MRRIMRALLAVVVPGAMTVAMVGGAFGAPAAQAYGTDHVYQLTYSVNCNDKNSPLCTPDVFGLGGAWGWIEPDSDGTADAAVTFCSHAKGQHGAFHENLDGVTWSIVSGSDLEGRFAVGVDPADQYIVFDITSDIGFIAFPATPSHYSMSFGPGVTSQATVVKMH
jgi:hypothetical protein